MPPSLWGLALSMLFYPISDKDLRWDLLLRHRPLLVSFGERLHTIEPGASSQSRSHCRRLHAPLFFLTKTVMTRIRIFKLFRALDALSLPRFTVLCVTGRAARNGASSLYSYWEWCFPNETLSFLLPLFDIVVLASAHASIRPIPLEFGGLLPRRKFP